MQRHHHTPARHRPQVRPVSTKGTGAVFGSYFGNHITRFINGAVLLSGKRFFTATNTLATPVVIGFFTDLLKWRSKIAAILDRALWNKSGKIETVSCR